MAPAAACECLPCISHIAELPVYSCLSDQQPRRNCAACIHTHIARAKASTHLHHLSSRQRNLPVLFAHMPISTHKAAESSTTVCLTAETRFILSKSAALTYHVLAWFQASYQIGVLPDWDFAHGPNLLPWQLDPVLLVQGNSTLLDSAGCGHRLTCLSTEP